MDLTNIFLFCLISLVIGAVLMILIQYYAFIRYFNVPDNETADQRTKSINEKYQLPDVSILGNKIKYSLCKIGSSFTHSVYMY